MHWVDVLIAGAAFSGVLALAATMWRHDRARQLRRRVRAVPLRSIADVADGERVRLVGEVELEQRLRSPINLRECVYWSLVVRSQLGDTRNPWATVMDESEGVDFSIRDATGVAHVKSARLHAALAPDDSFSSGLLLEQPPRELERVLKKRGHSVSDPNYIKRLQYEEACIEPGQKVVVVGVARWEPDPEAEVEASHGYRAVEFPQRLVIDDERGEPVFVSDRPAFLQMT